MTITANITTFWLGNEPVKYEAWPSFDFLGDPAVCVARYDGSDENVTQGVFAIEREGDSMRLVQRDGDIDPKTIEKDSLYRGEHGRTDIWKRLWDVALRGELPKRHPHA